MGPNHRAEPPDPGGLDAPAATPDAPDELDVLVDRLADEQATTAAEEARGPSDGEGRPEPPPIADEMDTLQGFLDFLRATIRWKVEGLSDEQASARMLGSATTVTGLVRHLADIERFWFQERSRTTRPRPVSPGAGCTAARPGRSCAAGQRWSRCAGCSRTWWRRPRATPGSSTCSPSCWTVGPASEPRRHAFRRPLRPSRAG